ncbi:anti-sigma factor domain-containing protein [Nesterenkonia sp. F]|uniref:anti-sigma factor domain-containing protein n=1 Tax=Nesterenkonia sp. F TaxID=795955 RepID=UPI000255C834|nr:anti-sigma factor [Nesterenkonia sp. F]
METPSPRPDDRRRDDADDRAAHDHENSPDAGSAAAESATSSATVTEPTPEPPLEPPHGSAAGDREPTLADLLGATAAGDQASFAAFYDATADVVHGLALLMHEDSDGADTATVAIYRHLWDQAGERARDLRLQTAASQSLTDEHADAEASYRPDEYEQVLEWLVPLAHRIMVERFREGQATPITLQVVTEEGGISGLPEEVVDDLSALSDSQIQAIALSYLVGATHREIAEAVGAAVPAVKSRLRDGMTRLHSRRTAREEQVDPILRAAVTRRDVLRSSGINRNFTREISADLEKGLLVELAEVYALDAIDERQRALLDESALIAESDVAQEWDTRVLAARRSLAEVFTVHPVRPPSHLIEEVLLDLGDQEVGMGMVEEFSEGTEEERRREPVMKRWMILTALALVVIVAGVLIWRVIAGGDVRQIADEAPDAEHLEGLELAQGGSATAVLAESEDLGYADFSDVGTPDGAAYMVWLMPADAQAQPASLGSYTAEELDEEIIEIDDLAEHRSLVVTVEEVTGRERPAGDVVVEIPLQDGGSGPSYGGPDTAQSPAGDDSEDSSDDSSDDGE